MTTKVLAFHHVAEAPALPVGPDIECRSSPQQLREVLETHAGWDVVDYQRGLDPGRSRQKSLVITFDDGYLDNLTEALPVLEEFDAPCIIFVVTGYPDGTTCPMETDLGWIISHMPPGETRLTQYRRQMKRLRQLTAEDQALELRRLAHEHRLSWPPTYPQTFLDWSRIHELHQHPLVTIGSHTTTHPQLRRDDTQLAMREAGESKKRLEAELGTPVETFAYPYGRHSGLTCSAVAGAGYRYAFTTRPRLIHDPRRLRPMAVPRFVSDAPPVASGRRLTDTRRAAA